MTQYREMIEKKRKQLQAEEWAQGVKQMHVHSLNSMWYEPNPVKIKSRKVMDIIYNDGRITRDGLEIVPSQLQGDDLIDAWEKAEYELCVCGERNCEDEYTHTTHGY